jgi:crotonobetainyl-CoA:carnitine CoA-transferase CaiB-like acyl-CoA transferase
MARNALTGVKVADFTWSVAGPLTVKFLADHGAEVIHVESSTRPELLRFLPRLEIGNLASIAVLTMPALIIINMGSV